MTNLSRGTIAGRTYRDRWLRHNGRPPVVVEIRRGDVAAPPGDSAGRAESEQGGSHLGAAPGAGPPADGAVGERGDDGADDRADDARRTQREIAVEDQTGEEASEEGPDDPSRIVGTMPIASRPARRARARKPAIAPTMSRVSR